MCVCVDQSHLISPQCLLTKLSCALSRSKCLFHLSPSPSLSRESKGPRGRPESLVEMVSRSACPMS